MPTTNFLQWNPGSANQEDDAAYLGDSLRAGGAPVGGIFPSATANKVLYQLSTMVTALADFIVARGFSASDASLATLVANLTSALASGGLYVLTWTATPTFDLSIALIQEITLAGNVTSSAIANVLPGQIFTLIIHQDGTGGRTFVPPGSVPLNPIDPGVSATSVQSFIVDAASVIHPYTPMTVS
jgi:hypothetical protein